MIIALPGDHVEEVMVNNKISTKDADLELSIYDYEFIKRILLF